MSDDKDLLLPGLQEKMMSEKETSTDETTSSTSEVKTDDSSDKPEVTDLGVVEVSEEEESEEIIQYRSLLDAAHDALDGKKIGEIAMNHPYWRMMEIARQYKHEKGL